MTDGDLPFCHSFFIRRDIYGNHQTNYPPYQQGGNHRPVSERPSELRKEPGENPGRGAPFRL